MEHLINYEDYQIKINSELLLIKPFRVLYNSDRTKGKDNFMSQLAIVYFGYDPRSTYSYISDEDERIKAIIEQEGLPSTFKIDGKLRECIDIYKKHTTTTASLLLQDLRMTVDNIRKFMVKVSGNLEAEDEKGRPKYQISAITTALDKALALIPKIQETEKMVTKELEEQGRARGGAVKKVFEDGFVD